MKPLSVVLPTSQPVPENPSKNPQQPGIKKKKNYIFSLPGRKHYANLKDTQ